MPANSRRNLIRALKG